MAHAAMSAPVHGLCRGPVLSVVLACSAHILFLLSPELHMETNHEESDERKVGKKIEKIHFLSQNLRTEAQNSLNMTDLCVCV